jgi:hypothetical protein
MEVITFESRAYKELVAKINTISNYIVNQERMQQQVSPEKGWVDSFDVCNFSKISKRTLQRLRTNKIIPFTKVRRRTYYRLSDIRQLLDDRVIQSNEECFQNLVTHYTSNIYQTGFNSDNL